MSRSFKSPCPRCGHAVLVGEPSVGEQVRCERCGGTFAVTSRRGGSAAEEPMLPVTCVCGRRLRASLDLAGQKAPCPACGAEVLIPDRMPKADYVPAGQPGATGPALPSSARHASRVDNAAPLAPPPPSARRSRQFWLAAGGVAMVTIAGLAFMLGRATQTPAGPAPSGTTLAQAAGQPSLPELIQDPTAAESTTAEDRPPEVAVDRGEETAPAAVAAPAGAAGDTSGNAGSRGKGSPGIGSSMDPVPPAAAVELIQASPPATAPSQAPIRPAPAPPAATMPAAAPAVQPPPTLAAINRSLMSTTPLIENGSLEEASAIILQARQDIEAFARFAELPLWDTSIASLMRIAETRQAAVERRRLATQPAGEVAAGSERPADRLSVEHTRQLAAIRNDLNRIPALLRENRLADAQQALDESRDRLQVFVTATDTREWNLPVASLFQLAARRQSELEEKATAARPAGGGLGGSFLPPADARPAAAAPAANAAAQNPPPATAPALQGLAVGQPAPAFNAMTVDGRPFSLQQFKGQWVLLEFWATWCGPCLGETPNLKDVFATYGNDKRFVMISLSVDDDVAKPANYAAENELGWIQGFVGQGFNGPAMKAYQVRGIPQFFLIDPQGRIAATRIRGQRIKEAVGEALAKK